MVVGQKNSFLLNSFLSRVFFVSRNVLSCARNYVSSLDFLPLAKLLGLIFGFTLGSWGPFFFRKTHWQGGSYGRETGWALWGLLLECLVGPVNRVC